MLKFGTPPVQRLPEFAVQLCSAKPQPFTHLHIIRSRRNPGFEPGFRRFRGGSIYRSRLPRSEGLEPLASRTFFEENRSSNFLSESKKILQCMWSGASDCASPLLRCVRVCAVVGDCVPQPPRRWELGNICEAPPISGGVSSEGCRVRTELERFTRFATLRHSAAASTRRGVVCLSNEAPLSYGCVSVCESNFCNKRSSSKALLRLQFMQLDEWFGSITSAAFAPMYLAKPAK